jgi:N,N'-diacetyllegionaminate synthase
MSVHIIAEAGTNHNGSEAEAEALIGLAHRAGADSVKVQIINPWGLYLPGDYDYGPYRIQDVLALRHQTVMADDVYVRLAAKARSCKVPLSASVFDPEGLALLDRLDPPYVKIASTDLNNLRFLRQVAAKRHLLILSTGLSELRDVERAVSTIAAIRPLDSVVLMHCVSVYPCRTEDMNLSFLATLKDTFGTAVGLSDHTQTSVAAVAAMGMGATWFEKHVTRNRGQRGLDHAYAMEEEPFTQYVTDLRAAEAALRPAVVKVSDAEQATRRRARRALYSARDIAAGETIADADVLCVRPEGPMSADEIDVVVGATACRAISKHSAFTRDVLA